MARQQQEKKKPSRPTFNTGILPYQTVKIGPTPLNSAAGISLNRSYF